jgi:hypothetical protein
MLRQQGARISGKSAEHRERRGRERDRLRGAQQVRIGFNELKVAKAHV